MKIWSNIQGGLTEITVDNKVNLLSQ